jgi:hypothetical protein
MDSENPEEFSLCLAPEVATYELFLLKKPIFVRGRIVNVDSAMSFNLEIYFGIQETELIDAVENGNLAPAESFSGGFVW